MSATVVSTSAFVTARAPPSDIHGLSSVVISAPAAVIATPRLWDTWHGAL